MDVIQVLLAIILSGIVGYAIVRLGVCEEKIKTKGKDGVPTVIIRTPIKELMTYTVVGSALVTAGVFYLLGWNPYEGITCGLVGGILIAGAFKVLSDKQERKRAKKREQLRVQREMEEKERKSKPPF